MHVCLLLKPLESDAVQPPSGACLLFSLVYYYLPVCLPLNPTQASAPLDLCVLESPVLSHVCCFVCAVPFAWSSFLVCCPWSPLDVTSFGKLFLIRPHPPVWVTCQAYVLVIIRISFSADFHSLILKLPVYLSQSL